MTRMKLVALGAMAALTLGGALNAVAADAAGEQPYEQTEMEQAIATPSNETRAQVEAEAAQQPPAAGQASERSAAAADDLTREQVETAEAKAAEKAGGFPDASGQQDPQPK